MSAPIHFEVELLFDALYQPLCENERGVDAFDDLDVAVEMTSIDSEVTCPKCLAALGYELPTDEQLTECHGDPFGERFAA